MCSKRNEQSMSIIETMDEKIKFWDKSGKYCDLRRLFWLLQRTFHCFQAKAIKKGAAREQMVPETKKPTNIRKISLKKIFLFVYSRVPNTWEVLKKGGVATF